ncbi:hypothetical protein HII31_07962 [Pseudocercospora fuligena]|uniref:Glycoside hydrolase 131 catalytic N-terminal domain-containing protein n=1 Tax=Pseudocercospora fuligena TaxID=685502 RepID=A0A8H6RGQ0_9PEZI|nr:hypothetical protein HII31_07962 [Pseudocercospora fuligena]
MFSSSALLSLVGIAAAGEILWDGRLTNYSDASFLADWSWSNQVGPFQYYIHGSGSVDDYVAVSASEYKNPADTATHGIQISIDDTSSWNGQTMMRTELIPSTDAAINAGKVFYHYSIQHTETDPPTQDEEHQICFFESHFTELKYGLDSTNTLHWMANSESQWNVSLEAGVWHNVAYGIDFDAQTVTFYHSTGVDELTLTAGPVSATTSSDGADWHLGVLRLPASSGASGVKESWHFSGVYIEDGELTISIAGASGGLGAGATTAAAASTQAVASKVAASSSAATTLQTKVKTTAAAATSTAAAECKVVYA